MLDIGNKIKYKKEILTIRIIHIVGVIMLFFSMLNLIYSGIYRYKNSLTIFSIMFLSLEGALVTKLRECPLTRVHKMFGDDKGFFGLFLSEKKSNLMFNISAVLGGFSILFYLIRII